jgi:hypothetical protein
MNGIGIQLPPWVGDATFFLFMLPNTVTSPTEEDSPRQSALLTFLKNMDLGKDFPKQVLR